MTARMFLQLLPNTHSCIVEEPDYVEIPVFDLESKKYHAVTSMKVPYLRPHDVLAFMHETAGAKTPKSHIEFYWAWGKRFKCGWAAEGDATIIPCGLYGDEAKYADGPPQEKILGIYLNFILFRPASIRHSRFRIFTLRSRRIVDVHTLYALFWKLVESLHYAFLGQRPDGSPLCSDGARFMVTELRGDLAWHRLCWQFPKRGWTSKDCCFWCDAKSDGRDDLRYTDFGMHAAWKPTEYKELWHWAMNTLPDKLCNSV